MPSVRDLYRKQTTQIATASLEPLALPHIATPSDPGAGNTAIYAKTDGKLYTLPAGGAETEVGSGSGGGREVLTANRTYYVRPDGNDSNDGLTNTAEGAFLTIQKAIDVVASLDISIYDVTIQLADGTHTIITTIYLKPPLGSGGRVYIKGNNTTPANVVVTSSTQLTDGLFNGDGANGVLYYLQDFKLSTTGTTTNGISLKKNFSLVYLGLDFGACTGQHISCLDAAICFCNGSYTISGGAIAHWGSYSGSAIRCQSKTITILGNPAFSTAFAAGGTCGQFIVNGSIYSGSATGVRYAISGNSVLQIGVDTLPGSSAGTATTGAQVV